LFNGGRAEMSFDPRPFVARYRVENEAELEEIKKLADAAIREARLDRVPEHIRARIKERGIVLAGRPGRNR
jgi:hypothetical protein